MGNKQKKTKKFTVTEKGLKVYMCATAMGLVASMIASPFWVKGIINHQREKWAKYDEETFGEYDQYFYKTDSGLIQKMIVDKKSIPVIIGDMDEQYKQYILDAITSLDDLSTNINYSVYDAKTCNIKDFSKYISINFEENLESTCGGVTSFKYNHITGEIDFPITIKLNKNYAEAFFDEEYTQSVLTTIVKHEMMHTLGLKDLYDESERGQSIMYYQITNTDFTERDKQLISYCYDNVKEDDQITELFN